MAAMSETTAISWPLFAVSGPVLWAASTHCDKYLLGRYFESISAAVLLIFTAAAGLVAIPIIYVANPDVTNVSPDVCFLLTSSGIFYMVAMFCYFQALQLEEASVVSPFFQATPLFGYILGYVISGERLTWPQALGGAFIICGTLAVSLASGKYRTQLRWRAVALMLCCAFTLAASASLFKFSTPHDDFWTRAFWNYFGGTIFGAVLLANSRYRDQIFALRRSSSTVLGICFCNEFANQMGNLGTRYALLLAPIGLVQAISSTSAIFVFLFGVTLTILLPRFGREDLSLVPFIQKSAAACLVVVGGIIAALA
jgi:drug/metabolite transporter (DMT)-like permease